MNGLNVLDLFCGAGGMSCGFRRAGFNVLLGIDSDNSAVETFKINHKSSKVVCRDIKQISLNEIRRLTENKKIDIIVGGPPCQGFSMAGRRIPNDPRNSLFKEYLRIVKGVEPKMFVMENVRGLLSMRDHGGRKVIDIILAEFSKIGYHTHCYSINTADYGVPQKRPRIFIVGEKGKSKFVFPHKSRSQNGLDEDGKKIMPWVSVNNFLIDKEKIDENYFYSKKLIRGFKRRERKNKKNNVGFGWKFLDLSEPSYTISARYWKDGAEALVKYNEQEIRMLTPEECAKIQSFPSSYKFLGNKRKRYTQIGNAVPPLMARSIAKEVEKALLR